MSNQSSDLINFVTEAHLLAVLVHPNILSVLGVVKDSLPMMVATPFMINGDLRLYLRSCRPMSLQRKEELKLPELLWICLQLCDACEYLENRQVVHRALMARNVLVGKDYRNIKLSGLDSLKDLFRSEEYVKSSDRKDNQLDIRWLAPESFRDQIYSTKSDVWSFGVMLWETMTYGRQPYGHLRVAEVTSEIESGIRLDMPDSCPGELYDRIKKCWDMNPAGRPTFASLRGFIKLLTMPEASELRQRVSSAVRWSARGNGTPTIKISELGEGVEKGWFGALKVREYPDSQRGKLVALESTSEQSAQYLRSCFFADELTGHQSQLALAVRFQDAPPSRPVGRRTRYCIRCHSG